MDSDMSRRVVAEFFGTFWLTFGGCGAAVLAAGFPGLGIGFLGVAFAFGLTVLTMAYAVGHISGGHFNPAVTLGLWAGGRCANKHVIPYVVAQIVGAVVAAAVLWVAHQSDITKPWKFQSRLRTSFSKCGFSQAYTPLIKLYEHITD